MLVAALLVMSCATASWANAWRQVAPGIEYRRIHALTPWSRIHVLRIDPKDNQLDLVMATDFGKQKASADEFAQRDHAQIALNAGFFDKHYKALGLRIGQYHELNPLKRISWWGIFYVKHRKPHLVTPKEFRHDNAIDFAVQSGPRLIIDGQIPSLKPGYAQRSALGITQSGKIIVLVTENAALSTNALAQMMRSPPLNCTDALNLDGGSSSQLHVYYPTFHLNVYGYTGVSDAITIKPRA